MGLISDIFRIDRGKFIDYFEITKVNDDAVTSGKAWVLAGYDKGYLHGMMTAIDTFSTWNEGEQFIGAGRTKQEAIDFVIEELGIKKE